MLIGIFDAWLNIFSFSVIIQFCYHSARDMPSLKKINNHKQIKTSRISDHWTWCGCNNTFDSPRGLFTHLFQICKSLNCAKPWLLTLLVVIKLHLCVRHPWSPWPKMSFQPNLNNTNTHDCVPVVMNVSLFVPHLSHSQGLRTYCSPVHCEIIEQKPQASKNQSNSTWIILTIGAILTFSEFLVFFSGWINDT